jgi:hypothetical protein
VLTRVLKGLSEQEDEWHYIGAWKQSTVFTYEVPFVMSTAELKHAMKSQHMPETRSTIVHTRVTPSLHGIRTEHSTVRTHLSYSTNLMFSTGHCTTSPSSFKRFERKTWSMKEDAANAMSNLSCASKEVRSRIFAAFASASPAATSSPPLSPHTAAHHAPTHTLPIHRWLDQVGCTHSEYWHNHQHSYVAEGAEGASGAGIEVEGILAEPVAESSLPNTARPISVVTSFEKVFIHQRLPLRVYLVISGEGRTYAEAEQNLWADSHSRASTKVVVEYALSNPRQRPQPSAFFNTSMSIWRVADMVIGLTCGTNRPHFRLVREAGQGQALHTYSFVCRHLPPESFVLAELEKANLHAADFASGKLHKNAYDILGQWFDLYDTLPNQQPQTSRSGAAAAAATTSHPVVHLPTSGKMPRVYTPDAATPFVHRPKLYQTQTTTHQPLPPPLRAPCSHHALSEECQTTTEWLRRNASGLLSSTL